MPCPPARVESIEAAVLAVMPATSAGMTIPLSRSCPSWPELLQLVGDLVDARLGAFVILAWRTGHADRADHVVADLDRQTAGKRNHARIFLEAGHGRLILYAFDDRGRRLAERARRVGL